MEAVHTEIKFKFSKVINIRFAGRIAVDNIHLSTMFPTVSNMTEKVGKSRIF